VRLAPATLRSATRPAERPGIGIVHLGAGAFHRAHQAVYTAEAVEHEPGDWGILGVAQRRPDAVEALKPQDGLYSVLERGPEDDAVTVYAAIRDVLLAPEEPDRLTAAIADPRVHVVTLTVTEKGYRLGGAVGQLARGIACRGRGGEAGPLTVVSCDNLPRNGARLATLVRDFLARDQTALEWLERHVRFPCTMVDRVVPAATDADRAAVASALGLEDHAAVVAEPFRQWVIEDDFPAPRPAWERAGAMLVGDAGPYEALKLRLLNGTHSLLAYAGGLVGAKTVAEAWADPAIAAVAGRLATDDIEPTLPETPGIDVSDYRAELGARWSNERIEHRLEQIAADGSQKLPARFGEPARQGHPPRWIALVVAAWARHLRGDGLPVSDPGAEPVREALARAGGPDDEARAVLSVFDDEVAEEMREPVADWLRRFDADGPAGTLKAAAAGGG
jgi:fructuronate reductase